MTQSREEQLRKLVEKWRKEASEYGDETSGATERVLADELEAILTQPGETAAPLRFTLDEIITALDYASEGRCNWNGPKPDLLGNHLNRVLAAKEPAAPAEVTAEMVRQAMDSAIKRVMKPDEAPNAVVKHYIGEVQFQIMAEELNKALAAAKGGKQS